MKLVQTFATIIAISAALTCTACNKKVEVNNATDQSWSESEVNSLFKFVPADSPMVIATTRKVGLSHPNHQAWRNKTAQLLNNANTLFHEYPLTELFNEVLGELNTFIGNFPQEAPKYGLNPNHLDAVAYIRNSMIVIQLTADDGMALKNALLAKIQSVPDFQHHVRITDIPVNTTTYSLFEFHDNDRAKVPRLAVKFDKSMVTIIPVWDADPALLAQFEQPVTNSFDKSKLGKIDKDTFIKGFVDNPNALKAILAGDLSKLLENALHQKLSESCHDELVAQLNDYPVTEMDVQIAASGNVSFHSSVNIKDKNELNKLQSLRSKSPDIISKDTAAALQFSMNLAETIDYIFETSDKQANQFTCPELKRMTERSNREIRQLKQGYMFVKSMFKGISGLSVSMDKPYDFASKKYNTFDDNILIRLDGPQNTLSTLLEMIGNFAPEFDFLKPNHPGEIVSFDLSEALGIQVKGNALLANNSLTIASTDKNIRQISAVQASPTNDYLRLTLSSGMIFYIFISEALERGEQRYISLVDTLVNKTPFQMNLSFGTNDNAGTMNYELNYLY